MKVVTDTYGRTSQMKRLARWLIARISRHDLGRREGLEADLLVRRALGGEPANALALDRAESRQAGAERVEQVRVGARRVLEAAAEQLERRPVLAQHRLAVAGRCERGELEHQRQVVGQLAVGLFEAAGGVQPLQPQQRHAALARVAVQVVGEVEARAPLQVEGLDVGARRARAAFRPPGARQSGRAASLLRGAAAPRSRRRSRRGRRSTARPGSAAGRRAACTAGGPERRLLIPAFLRPRMRQALLAA